MKALLCTRLGGPDALSIETLPDPEPGPGEAVVRIAVAALNFFDTLIIAGKYQVKPDLPFSPGGEACGTIEALGPDTRGFSVGDRVIVHVTFGTCRERMAVSLRHLTHLPEGLSDETAAGLTITYGTTKEIAARLGERGVRFLDAPISGMEKRAVDGTLTVMCGGDEAVFDAVKPLLERIGNKILYMGPSGSGQLTKLINQLLFDISAAALGEILPMAAKMGLDPDLVGEVVNSGTGRSYASEFFIPRILKGHFGDGYPMGHAYKDLVSAAALGSDLCLPMPVLAAATATYQAALLKGHGEKDKGGMVQVFEDLLGVQFRSRAA